MVSLALLVTLDVCLRAPGGARRKAPPAARMSKPVKAGSVRFGAQISSRCAGGKDYGDRLAGRWGLGRGTRFQLSPACHAACFVPKARTGRRRAKLSASGCAAVPGVGTG